MRKHKNIIIVTLIAVLVIVATLGAVAVAQADDQPAATANTTSIWDRVAAIFKQNTGTTINPADLKTAFSQAQQQVKDESLDKMLQKLVDSGKITQQQAADYKKWLDARPATAISDEYKQWLESRPEGISFGPGLRDGMMKRGMPRIGNMFRGFCAPESAK